jgi:hypothetical protein
MTAAMLQKKKKQILACFKAILRDEAFLHATQNDNTPVGWLCEDEGPANIS